MNQTEIDHAAIRQGFVDYFQREPSHNEAMVLHAVAYYETRMGRAWTGNGVGSKNLGAIQYATPGSLGLRPPYPPLSPDGKGFLYTDTSPNADGTSTRYSVYFRVYESLAAGAFDLARMVYKVNGRALVLQAATRGDVYGVSAAMYSTRSAQVLERYYEGWGATAAKRIQHHHEAMMGALHHIARELEVPLPGGGTPPPETLKRGDYGEPVRELQRMLAIVADGMFGPLTEQAVIDFQEMTDLKPDGVVGPLTWAALSGDKEEELEEEPDEELDPVEQLWNLHAELGGILEGMS